MSASFQNASLIAARYAGALIDLAEEGKALKKVEKDVADLRSSLENSQDFQNVIASPLIGKDKQIAFVDAVAKKGKLTELTANFLRVLVQNGRLNVLAAALAAFEAEVSKRRGEVLVNVKTAQDLSAKQLKSLQDTLKKHTGTDVAVNAEVDPAIIGGMVVTIGSQMVDDSVRRKLDRLKYEMGAGQAA
ncbi:MAG: F0F1 ATP synthase subunit delta [Alphaproteobacteria bacterium]